MPPMHKPVRQRTKRHAQHYLKDWREHLDITQDRAMSGLGWSQSKISRIENFLVPLTLDDLQSAADYYDVTTFELEHVNPKLEREVIDITPQLEKATPAQRKEIADFAEFVIRRSSQ